MARHAASATRNTFAYAYVHARTEDLDLRARRTRAQKVTFMRPEIPAGDCALALCAGSVDTPRAYLQTITHTSAAGRAFRTRCPRRRAKNTLAPDADDHHRRRLRRRPRRGRPARHNDAATAKVLLVAPDLCRQRCRRCRCGGMGAGSLITKTQSARTRLSRHCTRTQHNKTLSLRPHSTAL